MLKVPGAQTTSVRVSIGEMPAGENPHGVKRKVIKGDVSVEDVNKILQAIVSTGVKPHEVVIVKLNASVDARFNSNDNYYWIGINTGSSQPVRLLYNHEAGHLIDLTQIRNNPELNKKVNDAYLEGLEKGKAAKSAGKLAGIERTPEWKDAFNRELGDPANRNYKGKLENLEEFGKYVASQNEMIAEMFKLYKEDLRLQKVTGKKTSYNNLLVLFTKPHGVERAKIMRGFESLYEVLSTEVFPQAIKADRSKQQQPKK